MKTYAIKNLQATYEKSDFFPLGSWFSVFRSDSSSPAPSTSTNEEVEERSFRAPSVDSLFVEFDDRELAAREREGSGEVVAEPEAEPLESSEPRHQKRPSDQRPSDDVIASKKARTLHHFSVVNITVHLPENDSHPELLHLLAEIGVTDVESIWYHSMPLMNNVPKKVAKFAVKTSESAAKIQAIIDQSEWLDVFLVETMPTSGFFWASTPVEEVVRACVLAHFFKVHAVDGMLLEDQEYFRMPLQDPRTMKEMKGKLSKIGWGVLRRLAKDIGVSI
eukprot:NP_497101.2 Uncharacterized protein CELE_Y53F4B.16 [Caenorhabditis elegans]